MELDELMADRIARRVMAGLSSALFLCDDCVRLAILDDGGEAPTKEDLSDVTQEIEQRVREMIYAAADADREVDCGGDLLGHWCQDECAAHLKSEALVA